MRLAREAKRGKKEDVGTGGHRVHGWAAQKTRPKDSNTEKIRTLVESNLKTPSKSQMNIRKRVTRQKMDFTELISEWIQCGSH